MSKAAKTGLTEFAGEQPGIVVYAAKITAIETLPGGHQRAIFGEIGMQANLLSTWCDVNMPQIGGYFVVPETGGAAFMHAQQFEKTFSRSES